MARFDRYLLSQLLTLFGFFALVLVLIYWIRAAITLFDWLIADGQSAGVVLEFTALSLPFVIAMVLPLAGFVAAIYVTNRLTNDSEMIVVQATGFSPFRLARPVVYFGLLVTCMSLILTHVLVPVSQRGLHVRTAEVRENVAARLLVEGRFISPARGVTFYLRDIGRDSRLNDIFLSDARDAARTLTYTASSAYILNTERGPQLVMFDGMAQGLDTETGQLTVTTFDEFSYDIGALLGEAREPALRLAEYDSLTILRNRAGIEEVTGATPRQVSVELHLRNVAALLSFGAAMIGFAPLLLGAFSRFGLWRQIVLAIALAVGVKVLESLVVGAINAPDTTILVLYVPTFAATVVAMTMLWSAGRPRRVQA